MFATLWRHRSLVLELTKREFSGRYRGSFGGILWSFVQPLFLLVVYTIAFGIILKARWGFSGSTADYALMLFAGLIIFNAFSECLSKSTALVTSNPNFVKKVVFPLELLPVITVATALIHAMIGIVVWFLGYVLLFGTPKTTSILFPVILLCFVPVLLGLGWLLSALGVIVRDIGQLTGMLAHTLLFLTPIFYSIEAAPPLLQNLLMLNPLTFIVEQFRLVLFYGQMPAMKGLAIYFVLASLFAWVSLVLFRRLRPTFADMV
ncbi:MAG: ABC transporter permease [Gallionellaceae bacterium]|nr:ABC transporter permease [Gallionellaceae bacterium]